MSAHQYWWVTNRLTSQRHETNPSLAEDDGCTVKLLLFLDCKGVLQIKGCWVRRGSVSESPAAENGLVWFPPHWLPLSRLWPLAQRWGIWMRGGLWEGGETTLLWLKMCTCELSLSYADPDVNRGFLMSRRVDKHGIDSSFHPRLSSAHGLNSINWLGCNVEVNCPVRDDCLLHTSCWFEELLWLEELCDDSGAFWICAVLLLHGLTVIWVTLKPQFKNYKHIVTGLKARLLSNLLKIWQWSNTGMKH